MIKPLTNNEFKKLMHEVANSWNNRNAQKAVECFTHDAIYMEPPEEQLIVGHDQLLKYFTTEESNPMRMIWHNLMFDEETQVGAGEFTFGLEKMNHGVAVVQLQGGKIKLWREYYKSSLLEFDEFLNYKTKNFKYTLES